MLLQIYQNLIKITSNTKHRLYVALSGGLKCPRKIYFNTQCPPPSILGRTNYRSLCLFCVLLDKVHRVAVAMFYRRKGAIFYHSRALEHLRQCFCRKHFCVYAWVQVILFEIDCAIFYKHYFVGSQVVQTG